ncbi:MAG: 50S ribosomal protein L24 [Eubacteriales bacterium]|nr:50S ribosomal protein L24 [Eubacteriales bacterium]
MANKLHVKKGDTVVVIAGKDARKKGKILEVIPDKSKVVVEGINIAGRHTKPKNQMQQGGILKKEAPVHSSNVMLVCEKCGKPARTGKKILESGEKIRYCKKCRETIDTVSGSK